ncbi:MAG: tripartite tricarboxylate transporter family receptor [Hyphomicrobiales bacterium]|jgi:tripartite-type tricarboxylate transporter receptor subunit TctC|nr:tripartite tricarboxylate transporter family receptor [Hyphomicrobiales bacterium]
MKSHSSAVLALATACALAAASPALAQAPAEFYKGKTLTMVVGFSAGGGYDAYARLLARHLGRHIPGKPDIIVQNLPGAGSLNAVRQLEATQPKDGTYITTFNPALITDSLMNPEKVKFRFADVAWVGSMTPDVRVCYAWHTAKIADWDELKARKEFILGSTAKGTAAYVNGAILQNMFGIKVRQILGFPGGAEQKLALERGELDGDCGSWSSVPPEWISEKKITPLVSFSPLTSPDLPKEVPFIGALATTAEQKEVLDVFVSGGDLGRPFIMSKSVPEDRLKAVREAFDATMADASFLAEAKKLQLPINAVKGENARAIIERIYKASPEAVAKARQIAE